MISLPKIIGQSKIVCFGEVVSIEIVPFFGGNIIFDDFNILLAVRPVVNEIIKWGTLRLLYIQKFFGWHCHDRIV